jgi:hypothetical protein
VELPRLNRRARGGRPGSRTLSATTDASGINPIVVRAGDGSGKRVRGIPADFALLDELRLTAYNLAERRDILLLPLTLVFSLLRLFPALTSVFKAADLSLTGLRFGESTTW